MVPTTTPATVETAPVVELTPAPKAPFSLARRFAVPLLAYAASRVICTFGVLLAAMFARTTPHRISTVWDGQWYVQIALHGYPVTVPQGDFYAGTGGRVQSSVAFFPLYSLLVRALDRVLPGGADVAGLVLSLLFGALATVLVWILAGKVADRQVADRAAILFAVSPGAFVLSWVYAEGLLVLLAAGCLLALLERRWVLAGVLAALASATRPNATAVIFACAWAAGWAIVKHRDWRALVAPVLAPVGMLAFFVFLWWHTGETRIWFRVQSQGWGERLDFGRANLGVFADMFTRPLHNPNRIVLAVSMVTAVVLMVVLVRAKLPGVLNVYALSGLGLVLASHINARPRFIFVAFPLVIGLAKTIRKQQAFMVLVGVFAASMVGLTVLYGLRHLNWYP